MKTHALLWSGLFMTVLLAGCDFGPKSGKGFVFPEGNSARGRKTFVDMKCYTCHRVEGVADLPAPTVALEKIVPLGGKVVRVRTYGELVTAVIHPAYELTVRVPGPEPKVKVSAMPNVNDTMTVTQMLDIVTFLQPQYEQLEPVDQHYQGR